MRVLLQNTETNLYYIDTNEWTNDPLKATDFEKVDHAAHVYHAQNLAYARILVEPGGQAQQPVLNDLLNYVPARG